MSNTSDSPQYGAAMLRHLPLLREMIGRLGIREVVHRELPPDPRNRVVDADCVVLMIENVLHGRVALYGMNDWLEATDVDVILGEGCPADAFTDDRLAATLDHIHAYGVDDLLSAVVRGYLQASPGPGEYSVHTVRPRHQRTSHMAQPRPRSVSRRVRALTLQVSRTRFSWRRPRPSALRSPWPEFRLKRPDLDTRSSERPCWWGSRLRHRPKRIDTRIA